jgi:transposase-like protein
MIIHTVAQSARKVPKRPARYKTFTVKQKLEVVNYAASHNFSVAAKHYNINRTTIKSWSRQVEALRCQAGHRCRLGGGGRRPVMDVHMEKELEDWVLVQAIGNIIIGK